jgi:segregation and condensation protein B
MDSIDISYPRLKNILESLLFITKKPVTLEEISTLVNVDIKLIEKCVYELLVEYQSRGMNIAKFAGGYQMVTNQQNVDFVDRLLHSPIYTTLSNAAMETLSIIAYKQPITKQAIENIRGVNSDGVVATLIDKRLIEESGRSEALGHPMMYGTTTEFLRHFGLKDLTDLAPLPMDEVTAFKEGHILPPEQDAVPDAGLVGEGGALQ